LNTFVGRLLLNGIQLDSGVVMWCDTFWYLGFILSVVKDCRLILISSRGIFMLQVKLA